MGNESMLAVLFLVVIAFVIGKQYGQECERQRRAKDDARWRAKQKGEQIDETDRDWWLKH